MLDQDSIRIADEIANLSTGCQCIVGQFALKTGVPHFCHVNYPGKTVSFTLPNSRIVYRIFRQPISSLNCDSRERSANHIGVASTGIAEGRDKAGDAREAFDPEGGNDITNA